VTFTPTSEARSTTSTILLPAKPDCQRGKSEYGRAVRPSMSELWERSQIQSFLLAYSESRFSATSEDISTATSLLPPKPDPLLPVMPVSPLPVKLDPPLPACSHWRQIVREVSEHARAMRPNMSELKKWVCQSYRSELVRVVRVSMSELWEQLKLLRVMKVGVCACQSCPNKHVRVVQASMSGLSKWVYQSKKSSC